MKALKHKTGARSMRQVCEKSKLPYGTFMRWKGRVENGEDPIHPAGPKKVDPMNPDALKDEVKAMRHGRERSAGAGVLYEAHRDQVSRRQLHALVEAVRRELNQYKDNQMRRILWTVPGIVWAIDDTEFTMKRWGWHAYINQIHVLGARYDLAPCVSEKMLSGPHVALRLEKQFEEYGAPLIIKRDNGGNLNHPDVDLVLREYGVIALNSPTYYPPYNGAIERAQRELKEGMAERGVIGRAMTIEHIELLSENVVNRLNHKQRRVLDGQIACSAFSVGIQNCKAYSRRNRKEVYDQIVAMAAKTLVAIGKKGHRVEQAAWRMAVEAWLQEQEIITISQNREVLPHFPEF